MSLHIESQGNGEPLVLLHGWGMHGGVWIDVALKLAEDFRVHSVDLPGYGLSENGREIRGKDGLATLDSIVDELSENFTEPVTVCGWSLGGQIALHWAKREPKTVIGLVLVTSTPCFVEREDWIFGMAGEMLQKFAVELERDYKATLRRFIALQLRGSANERELMARLREQLFSRGKPDMAALRGGLEILGDVDLRSGLPLIKQPTLIIAGERDKLTPPEASYYLAQVIPKARIVEVEGAAHAPFLSHPAVFIEQVRHFLHE